MRQEEALQALAAVGVSPENVYFLGLPDRGLHKLAKKARAHKVVKSKTTKLSKVFYAKAAYPLLSYTGEAARHALGDLLARLEPTIVCGPARFDRHKDHAAAALLLTDVILEKKFTFHCYRYLIHSYTPWFYRTYPWPRGQDAELPLLPPRKKAHLPWLTISLTSEERDGKQRALAAYESQQALPELGAVMRSLVRSNELLLLDDSYLVLD
jgi:LmbE family N-acetylglucosaminyl deacetylase